MNSYLSWNNAIARQFFRKENDGKVVYLYVTQSLIDEIGKELGRNDFIDSMKIGPVWTTRSGLCQKALQAMAGWKNKCFEFPPYIAYLGLFVLAAGHEGDFAIHAYYPRLRNLLGEDTETGTLPSFDRMNELWDDLEEWLNIDQAGKLGILRADIAGAWLHVGIPAAQTVLTEAEKERLHEVFSDVGLDRDYPPSDLELGRIVHAHSSGFRNRTIRALEDTESEYRSVLIERILEELDVWSDKEEDIDADHGAEIINRVRGILCLSKIDEISKTLKTELRCRFRGHVPKVISVKYKEKQFSSKELTCGYSTPFVDEQWSCLDPTEFDWEKGCVLPSWKHDEFAVRWNGASVRIFAAGNRLGMPGFVEVQSLDPTASFIIASSRKYADPIMKWGASSCENFRELVLSGIPNGWTLYAGNSAKSDVQIRKIVPQLSFPSSPRRIKFFGGIHVPNRQTYFWFAPPAIRLDGGDGTESVEINGIKVERDADGSFGIPEEKLEDRIIIVQENNLRRVIYLEDGSSIPVAGAERHYSKSGQMVAATGREGDEICGVPLESEKLCNIWPLSEYPLHNGREIFIGSAIGEIANSPEKLFFRPIWVITQLKRDKFSLSYIPSIIVDPSNIQANVAGCTANSIRLLRREWKDFLWHRRKRMVLPVFEPLKDLWIKYQQVAERA